MDAKRIDYRTVDPPVTRENTVARIENPPLTDVVQRSPHEILRGVYTVGSLNSPKPCASGAEYVLCCLYDYSAEQPVWIEVSGTRDLEPGSVRCFEFSPVFVDREQAVPHLVATPLEHEMRARSALELMHPREAAIPEDLIRLVHLVHSLQEPGLVWFLEALLADAGLRTAFCTIGANPYHHHSDGGGLLRHSLEVAEPLQSALTVHPSDNVLEDEAAVVVALIHDLGRIRLAEPSAYELYGFHGPSVHEWLLPELVRPVLATLKHFDTVAYSALWGTLHAYIHRSRYQNPRVALIQGLDGHSARKDFRGARSRRYRAPDNWTPPVGREIASRDDVGR